jgi:chromosome segregation and condensation protein ScpB
MKKKKAPTHVGTLRKKGEVREQQKMKVNGKPKIYRRTYLEGFLLLL